MRDPEDVAAEVLSRVGRDADAAVRATHRRSGLTRFANSFIHQNVEEETLTVELTLAVGNRVASVSATGDDHQALSRLVDAATEAARLREPDPAWPGLAPPAELVLPGNADEASAGAGPDARATVVEQFVTAGEGLSAAGYCATEAADVAFLSTSGQSLRAQATAAVLDGVQRAPGSDGKGVVSSPRLDDIDGGAAGRQAAAKARAGVQVRDLPPGRYEVVLEPPCVADVLMFVASLGFNARAVQEERSFVHPGEQQFDLRLSIHDDAGDPRTTGLPFDHEGTPKRRVGLVEGGQVVGLAHDRRTGKAAGTESTGHAVAGGESYGAVPTNLVVDGAASPELLTNVERGLLVSDFWYTRVLDPKTLVVTGLTRNGVFLIENGAVTGAVSNLRFTQSYAAALGPGRVLGIGADAAHMPLGYGSYGHCVPSLHLASWSFTGGAAG